MTEPTSSPLPFCTLVAALLVVTGLLQGHSAWIFGPPAVVLILFGLRERFRRADCRE